MAMKTQTLGKSPLVGTRLSYGCMRMFNQDIVDLYGRVGVGTKVVVLSNHTPIATIAPSVTPAR